jgi:hypothetical protein
MRRHALVPALVLAGLAALAGPAAADAFGGFGGREDGYLVGRDRICTPLPVRAGKARGAPDCRRASADEVARLSVKAATPLRGRDASHAATARGRTLEVSARDPEGVVVTWEAADPIARVAAVYRSTYGNLVAVEYAVRRGGREVTEVVVFDLRGARAASTADSAGSAGSAGTAAPEPAPTVAPPAPTPAVGKAVTAARKASKGKPAAARRAWQKVLDLDPEHSEAHFGVAAAQARAKQLDGALAALEALAASARTDAVEYLVKARFDKAFAALRADARFRAAVGLDQERAGVYVRLMGHGGTWEQAETSCDTPGVRLELAQARTFRLVIASTCSGQRYQDTFKGRWEAKDARLTLILPNPGRDDEAVPCRIERDGDEDAIHCAIDRDLAFVVRPVRR